MSPLVQEPVSSNTSDLGTATRDGSESRWARHLLVVDVPGVDGAAGPVIPPVTAPLEVLREIGTLRG